MNQRLGALMIATALALVQVRPAPGQPAPRSLSFAEVATAAVQDNLQLRAASFEVAVAQAQLAQAHGGKMPQATLSGSYARSQERPGQTLSFTNPFGPSPSVITVTLPSPDPNLLVLRLGLHYPLYTGGRLESQIALADANLRGAQAVFQRTTQQIVFSTQQAFLVALLAAEDLTAAQQALEQADESLRVARARLQTGAAPEFDVLQAEVAVANGQQGRVRAQTAVRNAHASVNALLNLPMDTPLSLTDTLDPKPVPGTLASAVARALRIAGVRYQAGVGTSLELLTAQSTLAQAEFGLSSARFNQNLARIQLILVTGGSL